MPRYRRFDDFARRAEVDGRERETFCPADTVALDEDGLPRSDQHVEMPAVRRLPCRAKPRGAFFDHLAPDLRHARGRRAFARREREDMQESQPAFLDDL